MIFNLWTFGKLWRTAIVKTSCLLNGLLICSNWICSYLYAGMESELFCRASTMLWIWLCWLRTFNECCSKMTHVFFMYLKNHVLEIFFKVCTSKHKSELFYLNSFVHYIYIFFGNWHPSFYHFKPRLGGISLASKFIIALLISIRVAKHWSWGKHHEKRCFHIILS